MTYKSGKKITKTIEIDEVFKPSDIYPNRERIANALTLHNLRIVDFRPVEKGEFYLSSPDAFYLRKSAADEIRDDQPRFVVEPLNKYYWE